MVPTITTDNTFFTERAAHSRAVGPTRSVPMASDPISAGELQAGAQR